MESSGAEEKTSTISFTSNSNGETSSILTSISGDTEGTTSTTLSNSGDNNNNSSSIGVGSIGDSSDEKLLVSTLTRANFGANYIHQNFSLPDPIMEYIAKNPSSPELYQKLIQTCKYFFIKNPIIVVPSLTFLCRDDEWSVELYNGNRKKSLLNDVSSKFWVTDSINVFNVCNFKNENSNDHHIFSYVTQKLFRCDTKIVHVGYQNISINDLVLLASKSERVRLLSSTVVEDDGSVVPCEKVLTSLPFVSYFMYECADKEMLPQIFTSKTAEELIKIQHFATVKRLELIVPLNFNEFFKGNELTKIRLYLWDLVLNDYIR